MTSIYHKVARELSIKLDALATSGLLDEEDTYKREVWAISQLIFKLPKLRSGYISEKAVETGLSCGKLCDEHPYGRSVSAEIFIREWNKPHVTIDRLATLLKSRSVTHVVTSTENTRLKAFDTKHPLKGKKTIRECEYEAAMIKLVPYIALPKNKYYYIIDNIRYDVTSDILKKYNLTKYDTIATRCKSKKWPHWSRILRKTD